MFAAIQTSAPKTSVIPFAGVIDRATNRRLSGAVVDFVVPRKEKEKKIKL